MITCHVCGSKEITFYKQKRRDGVWVVTARCNRSHIPEKGKPFYSVKDFNLNVLPPLKRDEDEIQTEMFSFVKPQEKKAKPQPYRNFPHPIEET